MDSRIYGICASYAAWFRSNPEWARFAGAEWEWCLHAGRHWGDITGEYYGLPHEKYVETLYFSHRDGRWDPKKLEGFSKEQFYRIQKQRLADGYYCGVANAFYTTGASRIHKMLASEFRDSISEVDPCKVDHGYDYAAGVYAFPETSWGKKIVLMLKTVIGRDDIKAIAFDIPLESEVYRGEKLHLMNNVGFDAHGAGIVRGVANSKLYRQINAIPTKYGSQKVGTVINANSIHHVDDCFYADTIMLEFPPWHYVPPWPRSARYIMGEKGVTFWEGYRLHEFNANCMKEWTREQRRHFIQDLSRYVAHRSFLYGVTYPASFATEYLCSLVPAVHACSRAGYRVVPGVKTLQKEISLTRYGNAEHSLVAICNLKRSVQNAHVEVFPEEFRTNLAGGTTDRFFLFSGFFGGMAENTYDKTRSFVRCDVAPLGVNVLEAVGTASAPAEGTLQAAWKHSFGKSELTLISKGFQGEVDLRKEFGSYILEGEKKMRLERNSIVTMVYRNETAQISDEEIKNLPLLDENGQPRFLVCYAPDRESRDMAERVLAFFRQLGKSRKSSFELKLELIETVALPPYTIVLSPDKKIPEEIKVSAIGGGKKHLTVSGKDREEFSRLTRTLLDVLNALKYPQYIYGVPMTAADRTTFKSRRF